MCIRDSEYPELLIEPQFTGSSAGIEAVCNGTTDIGKDVYKRQGQSKIITNHNKFLTSMTQNILYMMINF